MTRPMNMPLVLVGVAYVFVRLLRAEVGRTVRRVVEIAEDMGAARGGRPRLHYVFRWSPKMRWTL